MKNKKVITSILLFLCVVIWGTIGWKVYSAFQDDDTVVPQPTKKNDIAEKKDTLHLLLNYRDPFLGDYLNDEVKEEKNIDQTIPRKEIYEEPVIDNPPDFLYKGIIRFGKNTRAMVQWNGKSLMLGPKDKIGEFIIVQIKEEQLTVSRKNKKYELSIQ